MASSEVVVAEPAKLSALQTAAADLHAHAVSLEVIDDPTYEHAAAQIARCRQLEKLFDELMRPGIKRLSDAHKAALADLKGYKKPVEDARHVYDRKKLEYSRKVEAERLAEERRRAKEAREAEEARRLEAAEELAKDGQHEAADAVLEAPITTPIVSAPVEVPKIEGQHVRKWWSAVIENADLVPREFCTPSQTLLNQHARQHEGRKPVPGVRFVCDERTVTRGA